MKRAKSLVESLTYCAAKKGLNLLFFGAVHGNETCGTQAIRRVIGEIEKGKVILRKGSVTFVPVCNAAAYAKNVRYVQENLNRIFKVSKNPKSIEAKLANELCRFIDYCDVFLDIHSTTAKGKPFIYLDFPTVANRALAKKLGPSIAITGWPELYKKQDKKNKSYDTTTYAASKKKDCLLIECGQHLDKAAPRVAYKAILNTLRHYGLVAGKATAAKMTEIRMSAGYFRDSVKDRLAGSWEHLDRLKKGAPMILKSDGKIIPAPYDCYIIMPKATAKAGEDWLYLARCK